MEGITKLIAALTDTSGKVKQLVEEVSGESGDQAGNLQEISKSLLMLQEITTRNAASAEENAAAGTELQSQAVAMQGAVEELSA